MTTDNEVKAIYRQEMQRIVNATGVDNKEALKRAFTPTLDIVRELKANWMDAALTVHTIKKQLSQEIK